MKIINALVFSVFWLFSISAIGQINPDDRFGTYLDFESGDSSVVSNGDTITLDILEVEESEIAIFEKVANPDPNPWPKINNSATVGKITTTASTWPAAAQPVGARSTPAASYFPAASGARATS